MSTWASFSNIGIVIVAWFLVCTPHANFTKMGMYT